MIDTSTLSLSTFVFIFSAISLLIFIFLKLRNKNKEKNSEENVIKSEPQAIPKWGRLQIFFGSQTGTGAKLAQTFGIEADQEGFTPQVIDLNNLNVNHFKKGQISVFFLSNTGEGDPPDNAVVFMKILRAKSLDKVHLTEQLKELRLSFFKNITYAVFGLGNTQYQHYNKIGIQADQLLAQKGALRLLPIGLGDNNASLQDDYNSWKTPQFWQVLKQYRKNNPIEQIFRKQSNAQQIRHQDKVENIYLSNIIPTYANWRFTLSSGNKTTEDELDFRTKAYLKSTECEIVSIKQKRQNTNDGSSLQLVIKMKQNSQYATASNIALWPQNDPNLVQKIGEYFNLNLQSQVGVQAINDKKIKLNFVAPITLRKLLTNHIDLQHKITKSILKKLGGLPSKNQQYFIINSSIKTTEQYKRLTERQFNYLFHLVQIYDVKITFQDFIQLSESVSPRLFTIASSYKNSKNVVIVASIIKDGLISNYFLRNPINIKGQLRKSTFTDAMKWNKLIFVSAGTGFAPFKGFLQDKEYLMKNGNNSIPKISLFYGCKHQNGDFIYKQEIGEWIKNGVINRFIAAFSRDQKDKIYVQHILYKERQQLKQFIKDQTTAMYMCGSLSMGNDVVKVLLQFLMGEMGENQVSGKAIISQLQKSGRLVKQLW